MKFPDVEAFFKMTHDLTKKAIKNPGAFHGDDSDAKPTPPTTYAQSAYTFTTASAALRKRLEEGTPSTPRHKRQA